MKKLITALVVGLVSYNAVAGGHVAAGEALVKKYSCASCHGANFDTPIDPSYPKLAGQHPDYVAHALVAYRRGDGANGRNNPIMSGLVKALSDKDIADISAYIGSLPGTLATGHR